MRLYGEGAALTLERQPLGGTRAEVVLPGLAAAIRVTA
jgi:hypothetical protein